ncbi:hypothetical protein [Myxococcus xanthus]|uniref:hypothetical protein n=2 Tax=Myxococcus xanthus TaxID=34 RepID=UPI001F229FF3|nr:hypothetical protein [Myxococcus xanthus]
MRRYYSPGGIEMRPEDFERTPISLFVADGTSLNEVPGRIGGPGEFIFSNVPNGTYYVKVGMDYVVTRDRDVDLSINLMGRPDVRLQDRSFVYADISLNHLEPWQYSPFPTPPEAPGPSLEIMSEEVPFFAILAVSDALAEGQTSWNESGRSIGNADTVPVFERERGDRIWVHQYAPRQAETLPDGTSLGYISMVRSAQLPPLDFDGTHLMPIQGSLQAVPSTDSLSVDWKVSDFKALAEQAHPGAQARPLVLSIVTTIPGEADVRVPTNGPILAAMLRPPSMAEDVQTTLVYGNPYPSNRDVLVRAFVSLRIPRAPGANQFFTTGSIAWVDRVANLSGRPIRPLVQPPRALTVDGADGYLPRTLTSGPQVISWQAPADGVPDGYVVSLGASSREGGARIYLAGDATSVVIPPDLLPPGTSFLHIDAIRSEGYARSGQPMTAYDHVPRGSATAVSGALTVPNAIH